MAAQGAKQAEGERSVDGGAGGLAAAGESARDLAARVWAEHRRWVAAILLAHKPRETELDDLLQSVAASVVRKVADVRDPAALKPWLRTVAINEARLAGRKKVVRQRGLRLVTEREARAGGGVSREEAEHDPDVGDRARRVLELAGRLPEAYREPLLLRCARGMSYRQISEITGLPETTIETRIARGRRMLRSLVEESERERESAQEGRPKEAVTR